jgi:anti-anti-sigma regulatory factor
MAMPAPLVLPQPRFVQDSRRLPWATWRNGLTQQRTKQLGTWRVVFSFFKKDPKEAKKPAGRTTQAPSQSSRQGARPEGADNRSLARPLPGPVNRSLNNTSTPGKPAFATTENAIPDRELARSLAMATAAKIDAIESEMSQDFLRPLGTPVRPNIAANSVLSDPVSVQLPAPVPDPLPELEFPAPSPDVQPRSFSQAPEPDEPFDPGELATTHGLVAVELGSSDSTSALDEAAILFANGQDQAAETVLRNSIEADALGAATERGWLMMFEFLQQRGDKAGFERLTMQYALRFEHSAPGWIDYEPQGPAPEVKGDTPVTRLPEKIGANIVKPLEQLKALAMTNAKLTLDLSEARSIDPVGAELLLRVLKAFARASHELLILGAEQLINPLRAVIEPGRRDSSDACWMLLLDLQRLLGRQEDFEETGIQYCITYEVSPPSWEAAPVNIKTRQVVEASPNAPDPLDWRGEITGDGEPMFGRMLTAARVQPRLAVECRYLRRMGFSAASQLLGHIIKLQQLGTTVEFRNVNALVGGLLQLLGISAMAEVQLRRN